MFDSKFLSGSVAFILRSSRRFLSVAAILSSLVWVVLSGHYQEAGWGGWQHCHSPLHRSLLSQLTACNLGMKAAFSLFLQPPPVTLHSRMSHASLGSEERGPPSLKTDFFQRRPLVVSEACSEPRPGLDEASMTCDTILTHQRSKCTAGERRKAVHKGGIWG